MIKHQLMDDLKAAGVPPHWLGYVTVEDAAATAAKAKQLGGTVLKDAFDIFDIGTMAVLQDPTGAAWFFRIKVDEPGLVDEYMDEDAYKEMIE